MALFEGKRRQRLTRVANSLEFLVTWLLPWPLTYAFIQLMGHYYYYYDIGINMSANSLFLLVICAPFMLVQFYVSLILATTVAGRRGLGKAASALLKALVLAGVLIGSFLIQVWQLADYPSPRNKNLLDFMAYVLGRP